MCRANYALVLAGPGNHGESGVTLRDLKKCSSKMHLDISLQETESTETLTVTCG